MKNRLQKQVFAISLVVLLLAGCGAPLATSAPNAAATVPSPATSVPQAAVPTSPPMLTWFAMQYLADTWHAENVEENFLLYGLLTHRTLPHCQVMLLSEDPSFILDKVPEFTSYKSQNWSWDSPVEKATDLLRADLWTVKDDAGLTQLVYYEAYDKTGFFGHDNFRLGFFVVNRNSPDPQACAAAFWDVLTTLQVEQWNPLPVGQG